MLPDLGPAREDLRNLRSDRLREVARRAVAKHPHSDARTAQAYAMTLIEAARLLGTTPDNLRQAIARGSLRAEKVGRDWQVAGREVERYRTENRRGTR